MGHVFLSYSRKDIDVMQRVRDSLRSSGINVWTDENLTPGTRSWKKAIETALENASCLVVILSPDSKQSDWVLEEMNYAEAQNIRIFPILAKGDAKNAVPFGYITAQWIDIRVEANYTSEMQKLTGSLYLHMGVESSNEPIKDSEIPKAEVTGEKTLDLPQNLSPELVKAVEILQNTSNKWWRRADAARTLADTRDLSLVPILEVFADDPDIDVQRVVQRSIQEIKTPRRENTQPKQNIAINIVGPYLSGKTTFNDCISEIEGVSSKGDPNVSQVLDFGRATVDESLVLYFFGTPGQKRFDFMWEILSENLKGFIVVIDSSRPETFYEAMTIAQTFARYNPVPFVVAANKQDLPEALSTDTLRSILNLKDHIKLISCVASDKEMTKSVTLELLYDILENMDKPTESYVSDFPQAFHPSQMASVKSPSVPAQLRPVAPHSAIEIVRGFPDKDSETIAALLNAVSVNETDANNVKLSFGKVGYFLAKVNGDLIGIVQFYIEDLITRISLSISQLAPREKVAKLLLESVHQSARELQAEVAFSLTFDDYESAFEAAGYERTRLRNVRVSRWRSAMSSYGLQETMFIRLRPDQVLKPI